MMIKSLFLARSMREKFLVLGMLIVGFVIWSSLFAERAGALMEHRDRLNRLHEDMSFYLDNREAIRARVEEGIQNLDPAHTLTATRLSVDAGNLARRHGLRPSIDSPRTEPGDVFSYHTIQLSVNEADLASLIAFTRELQERSPYMALEQVRINPRPNPTRLDARFRISSVELNP